MGVFYEVRVDGHLDARWFEWFDGLQLAHLPNGETVLCVPLPDQAALHGLLARIRDLNLTLIAVTRQQETQKMVNAGRKLCNA